jgi:hypothetical protein
MFGKEGIDMVTFERWKRGLAIGYRLFMLGIVLSFIVLPLNLLQLMPQSYGPVGGLIAILYCVLVVPLCLPTAFAMCGLETRCIGSSARYPESDPCVMRLPRGPEQRRETPDETAAGPLKDV